MVSKGHHISAKYSVCCNIRTKKIRGFFKVLKTFGWSCLAMMVKTAMFVRRGGRISHDLPYSLGMLARALRMASRSVQELLNPFSSRYLL